MIQCKMVLPEQHAFALRVRVGHDLETEHTASPDRMFSQHQRSSRCKPAMFYCGPAGSVVATIAQRIAMFSAFYGFRSSTARMI